MDDEDISYIRKAELRPVDSSVVSVIESRERRQIQLFGIGVDAFWDAHRQAKLSRSISNPLQRRWVRCIRIIIRKHRARKMRDFLEYVEKMKVEAMFSLVNDSYDGPTLGAKSSKHVLPALLEPLERSPLKPDPVVEAINSVDEKLKRGENSMTRLEPIDSHPPVHAAGAHGSFERQTSNSKASLIGVRRGSLDKSPTVENGKISKADPARVGDALSSKNIRRRSMDGAIGGSPSSKSPSTKVHPLSHAPSSRAASAHGLHTESMMHAVAGAALSAIEHAVDGIVRKTGALLHGGTSSSSTAHSSKPSGPLRPLSSKTEGNAGNAGVSEKVRRKSLDSAAGGSNNNKRVNGTASSSPSTNTSAKRIPGARDSASEDANKSANAHSGDNTEDIGTATAVDSSEGLLPTGVDEIITDQYDGDTIANVASADELGELKAVGHPTRTGDSVKRLSSVEVPDSLQFLSSLA